MQPGRAAPPPAIASSSASAASAASITFEDDTSAGGIFDWLKASSSGPAPRELRARGDPAQRAPHEQGRPEGRPRRSATARRPLLDRHPDAGVGCVRAAARRGDVVAMVLVLGRGDGGRRGDLELKRPGDARGRGCHPDRTLGHPSPALATLVPARALTFSGSSCGAAVAGDGLLEPPGNLSAGATRRRSPAGTAASNRRGPTPHRASEAELRVLRVWSRRRSPREINLVRLRPARAKRPQTGVCYPLITTFRACRNGRAAPIFCVQN